MAAAVKLQRNWEEVKGKLRDKWNQLNSDDLHRFDGDVDMLVELIERKTGASRESIEQFISEVGGQGYSILSKATEAAEHYGKEAIGGVQKKAAQLTEGANRRLHDAEAVVRQKPLETAVVCLGAGIACGVLLGLTLRACLQIA
jgi:uncharacterized protein YjbJ (UPF0337 family)